MPRSQPRQRDLLVAWLLTVVGLALVALFESGAWGLGAPTDIGGGLVLMVGALLLLAGILRLMPLYLRRRR